MSIGPHEQSFDKVEMSCYGVEEQTRTEEPIGRAELHEHPLKITGHLVKLCCSEHDSAEIARRLRGRSMVRKRKPAGDQRRPAQQLPTLHSDLPRRGVGHVLGWDSKSTRQPSEAVWTRDLASLPIVCRLSGRATLPALIFSRSSYQGGHVGER